MQNTRHILPVFIVCVITDRGFISSDSPFTLERAREKTRQKKDKLNIEMFVTLNLRS